MARLFIHFLVGGLCPFTECKDHAAEGLPSLVRHVRGTRWRPHKYCGLHDVRIGKQRRAGGSVASTLSAAQCQQPGEGVM